MNSPDRIYEHWSYQRDPSNVLWLIFDRKGASTNTINAAVLEELADFLEAIVHNQPPLALVIQSAKASGFIAGADINAFKHLDTYEGALQFIQQGQTVLQALEDLPCMTIALIQGFCLGGGLELALACHYRIAVDDPKTIFGLPEVQLGIHPAWGGTIRLPRLIGPLKGLEYILSGKTLSAHTAQRLGLVDVCVPKRQALQAILDYTHRPARASQSQIPPTMAEGHQHAASVRPGFWRNLALDQHASSQHAGLSLGLSLPVKRLGAILLDQPLLRKGLAALMRRKLQAKIKLAHYPAPFLVLDHWQQYGLHDPKGFEIEAQSAAELACSKTAHNLARVFYLKERLKRIEGMESTPDLNLQVHVIGAGRMGGDIAAWCALKGQRVTLADQNPAMIASALGRARLLFEKVLHEPHRVQAAYDRLIPDLQGSGVSKADLIIEAIVEQPEAKRRLFQSLAHRAKADAVLATNTSTIPLRDFTEDPVLRKRLIGLHFFNPVAQMPLVEVVSDQETDPLIVQKGLLFVRGIDKLALPVQSSPGFLVNRILMPYLLEAVLLVESGLSPQQVDQCALDFGMPIGPIALADIVGLDVCAYAGQSLIQALGLRSFSEQTLPLALTQRVAAGQLGQKTGQGFYRYAGGKAVKAGRVAEAGLGSFSFVLRPWALWHDRQRAAGATTTTSGDASDRLLLSLLNASVACLRERVVADADSVDAGLIFGAGFAPFEGGPMQLIAQNGATTYVARLKALATRYGERFTPDPGWQGL